METGSAVSKKDNILTGRLFRITFSSLFVSNIMTVLGAVIDGFVVGNTMDRVSVAAAGLVFQMVVILNNLIVPLFVLMVNRKIHGNDLWWMMPEDYGVSPEDELRAVITTQDDVMEFSQKAWEFCKAKGMSERTTYLTSLAIEEMATNVVTHGFTKDNRDHTLSIRLIIYI